MTTSAGMNDLREAVHHRRFRWRGAVGAILLVPATVVALFSEPVVSASSSWHLGLRAAAWALFLAGAALRFWVTLYLGGQKEKTLVIEGPYSVVRHPLYLGSLLIGLSAGLFLESLLFEAAMGIAALVYAGATIPVEEAVLQARYGRAHQDYVQRVSRYWPSWRTFHTPSQLRVDVRSLRLEFARASRWAWIPVIGEIVTFLHGQRWWPHLFRIL